MAAPNLHNALLRPPIIQILRAAGFHSTRPAVLDTLADVTARYLLLLASSTAEHANITHEDDPVPTMADVRRALHEAGALRPQKTEMEERFEGEEDLRGVEAFTSWFSGPEHQEIRRIAGFVPSEGDLVDADSVATEDYLTALKKKHSKTGEESRYQGTTLGKSGEEHPIVIEGGIESIKGWGKEVKTRAEEAVAADSSSSAMSSVPSGLSDDEVMGGF
ncbi:hypothetical protein FQN54_009238 [Arachnomyces sp. PD_36]|nr:hypothetical protein FQN54_009238 [Arachnomyces sp. PD_36]